jgi:hypothetical protein
MSIAGIAEVARRLDAEARERVEAMALEAQHEIMGITAALQLHDEKHWATAAVVAVAGALLRLIPTEKPELAYSVVEEWHRARGGVVEEEDDIGAEAGNA